MLAGWGVSVDRLKALDILEYNRAELVVAVLAVGAWRIGPGSTGQRPLRAAGTRCLGLQPCSCLPFLAAAPMLDRCLSTS